MAVRPIDGSRFAEILEQWKKDCLQDNDQQSADVISDVILQLDDMPTLTPPNEPLTLEQLREMEDPVWCVCKTVEGFEGFWCLCNHGYILTPARQIFDVKEIPHWVFYRRPPEGEVDGK